MRSAPSEARARPRRLRRPWVLGVLLLLLVVIACLAWVGVRTALAVEELRAAEPLAATAQDALGGGDADAAAEAIAALSEHTAAAAGLTSDPVYRLVELVPLLGPNLDAIRRSSGALDSVVSTGLSPLAPLAAGLSESALAPAGGVIDLEPFVAAAPALSTASSVADAASMELGEIDQDALLPPVAEAVSRLDGILSSTRSTVSAAANTAALLPAMLGAEEQRQYVLLFQNNAEVRASGGIPGALALVATSDGSFALDGQTTANDFPEYPESVVPLDAATLNLSGDLVGRKMQNVGLVPDFPTTGPIVAEMWKLQFGTEIDGVIAVDPVTVGYLLRATGPLTLPTGDIIDSDNAVDFLLSGVYAKYPDTTTQDLVFAATARAVFTALSSGGADTRALVTALATASDERRILIWNARADEQQLLEGTTFAGTLPDSNVGASTIGVFFNDVTGAKMDYYLDASASAGVIHCTGDSRTYRTTIDLTSSAPADAATSLPAYVTANGAFGVPPGDIRTRVLVYGPVGASTARVSVDGTETPAQFVGQFGRPVVQLVLDLAPVQTHSVEVVFEGAVSSTTAPVLQLTPLIRPPDIEIASPKCT